MADEDVRALDKEVQVLKHEKMELLKANGEIAYLWAVNQDVVKAVRDFLNYLDEPLDKPGDGDRELALNQALRDTLADADKALKESLPIALSAALASLHHLEEESTA